MTKTAQVGRLAMRHEGDWWVAYYAMPNTMDDAIEIGRVRMTAVVPRPERKAQFLDAMREIVSDIVEEKAGVRPTWGGVHAAPEHERAGNG